MTTVVQSNGKKRRAGAHPRWAEKNPKMMEFMEDTDLRVYEIANIIGLHPDSLGKKLRYGLSEKETDQIIAFVSNYLEETGK